MVPTTPRIHAAMSRFCIYIRSNQPKMRYGLQSYRSMGTLGQTKRKVGRPRMAKGEAKGRIVPVRFRGEDLKLMTAKAKAANQTVSHWIRSTVHAALQS